MFVWSPCNILRARRGGWCSCVWEVLTGRATLLTVSRDVAEELHRCHNTQHLLLVSWPLGFIWNRGKQAYRIKRYACFFFLYHKWKSSFSRRYWEFSITLLGLLHHQGKTVRFQDLGEQAQGVGNVHLRARERWNTREYVDVGCVSHAVVSNWPLWKVCRPPWRWGLKVWPSQRTQRTGWFPWLPHFVADWKNGGFCHQHSDSNLFL